MHSKTNSSFDYFVTCDDNECIRWRSAQCLNWCEAKRKKNNIKNTSQNQILFKRRFVVVSKFLESGKTIISGRYFKRIYNFYIIWWKGLILLHNNACLYCLINDCRNWKKTDYKSLPPSFHSSNFSLTN